MGQTKCHGVVHQIIGRGGWPLCDQSQNGRGGGRMLQFSLFIEWLAHCIDIQICSRNTKLNIARAPNFMQLFALCIICAYRMHHSQCVWVCVCAYASLLSSLFFVVCIDKVHFDSMTVFMVFILPVYFSMHRVNPTKKVFFTPFSYTHAHIQQYILISIHVSATTRVDAFARTINAIYWRRALTKLGCIDFIKCSLYTYDSMRCCNWTDNGFEGKRNARGLWFIFVKQSLFNAFFFSQYKNNK